MRNSLVPVAVALLCVVGIGLGAAAITDSLDGGGSGSGSPASGGQATGDSNASVDDSGPGGGGAPTGQPLEEDDECAAGYDQSDLTVIVVLLALTLSVLGAIHNRELMAGVVTFPLIFLPGMAIVIAATALLNCPPPGGAAAQAAGNVSTDAVTEAVSSSGGESDTPVERFRLGIIFVAALGALGLLGLYLRGRKRRKEDEQTLDEPEVADEVISAAGDAADEITQVSDSENAVYRAWARMAEPLDVEHPEASTPGEFADAALAAGLDTEDVDELTELFEQVRYGTTPITEEHEQRAKATLRRIERSGESALESGGDRQ
jgi:hypothetical protein